MFISKRSIFFTNLERPIHNHFMGGVLFWKRFELDVFDVFAQVQQIGELGLADELLHRVLPLEVVGDSVLDELRGLGRISGLHHVHEILQDVFPVGDLKKQLTGFSIVVEIFSYIALIVRNKEHT